jgi:hypothetical protein
MPLPDLSLHIDVTQDEHRRVTLRALTPNAEGLLA